MRYRKDVFTNLTMITQLSIHMMTPIFLCLAIGLFIDKTFGTKITVVMLILGVLAGARNAYILAMRAASSGGGRKKSDYIVEEYSKKISHTDEDEEK